MNKVPQTICSDAAEAGYNDLPFLQIRDTFILPV